MAEHGLPEPVAAASENEVSGSKGKRSKRRRGSLARKPGRVRRRSDSGGRRQGREMALQMLYQWESSACHPSEVLRSFDLALYLAETAEGEVAPSEATERSENRRDAATISAEHTAPLGTSGESGVEAARKSNVERQVSSGFGSKSRSRAFRFAQALVLEVIENQAELDRMIAISADNWRIERMPVVDRNILRMALQEFTWESEAPRVVIINEAIELAKRFGSENSGAFVNGILDALLRVVPAHPETAGSE